MTQRMISPTIKLAPPTPQAPLSAAEIDAWEAGLDVVLGLTPKSEQKPTPHPQTPQPAR